MNWDAVGAIAELLGAVAVFATLFYLAIQVRHGSKVTAAATSAGITRARNELNLAFATNPKLQTQFIGWLVGDDSLDAHDIQAAETFMFAIVNLLEDGHKQLNAGFMSREQYEATKHYLGDRFFASPVAAKWWKGVGRTGFAPDFRAEVDELIEG